MNDTLDVLAVGTRVAIAPYGYSLTEVPGAPVGVVNAVIVRDGPRVAYEIAWLAGGVRHTAVLTSHEFAPQGNARRVKVRAVKAKEPAA